MLFSLVPFVVGFLSLTAHAKIHSLKLHKLAPVPKNPDLEGAWLAEKYGFPSAVQMPLIGAGGSGRHLRPPTSKHGEPLFRTQGEHADGGHRVPLSSELSSLTPYVLILDTRPRLHECSVLHRNWNWNSSPDCQSSSMACPETF